MAGKLEGGKAGGFAGWLVGSIPLIGFPTEWVASYLIAWRLVRWLALCMTVWLVRWLDGWLADQSAVLTAADWLAS